MEETQRTTRVHPRHSPYVLQPTGALGDAREDRREQIVAQAVQRRGQGETPLALLSPTHVRVRNKGEVEGLEPTKSTSALIPGP
jgi:hypothetical protein